MASTEHTEEMAYVASKTCGCPVFVTVDSAEHRKDTAREIARCLRDGLAVNRMTVEAAREILSTRWFGQCEHDVPKGQTPSRQMRLGV